MPPFQIMPSVLAADHGRFIDEAATVDIPDINWLHIDVMDGHFVPNITFGPRVVASLKAHTRFQLDVHLMINNVDDYIPAFAQAGASYLTIHQEAARHLHRSLMLIRENGVRPGVAINPATPLESIRNVLGIVDLVLVMSVNPGFGGQSFIMNTLQKLQEVKQLRDELRLDFAIEVDGGIDALTAPLVVQAGAELLVAGSAIFGAEDRPVAIRNILDGILQQKNRKPFV